MGARDLLLFGNFEKAGALNWFLDIDAWELEDAVALTLGKDPRDLSLAIIREKCPDDIANRKLVRTQPEAHSPLTQLYMERYERLKRAAFVGSLQSVERGGKVWFKPHDFLTWYDTKSGWKDDLLPLATKTMLETWRAKVEHTEEKAPAAPMTAPSTAPRGATDTGEKPTAAVTLDTDTAGSSSPRVSESDKLDVAGDLETQCVAYLISEMCNHQKRTKSKNEYRKDCNKRFKGLGSNAFYRSWKKAISSTDSIAPRGRKSTVNKV